MTDQPLSTAAPSPGHIGLAVPKFTVFQRSWFIGYGPMMATFFARVSRGRSSLPVRVFWGLAMGLMAINLISLGSGGIGKLQSFIVVTAVPVSLMLLPSLWDALRIKLAKGRALK